MLGEIPQKNSNAKVCFSGLENTPDSGEELGAFWDRYSIEPHAKPNYRPGTMPDSEGPNGRMLEKIV